TPGFCPTLSHFLSPRGRRAGVLQLCGHLPGQRLSGRGTQVTCRPVQNVCAEGLIAWGIGGQRMLVVVKKGCHAAQYRDLSGVRDGPYLPIYSHTRFCNASLCNHRYWDNCHIPAFPTDNTSASLWCYACIGTTPESCSLRQAQQSRCYDDSPRCFDGTGMATIGAVGCVSITPGDPWLNIQLERTSCCAQPLCNHTPEPAPTASPRPSRTASTRDRPANASPRPGLPLPTLLLLLGGWAWGAERAALGSGQGWRHPL
ncbi:unnamed protein product, partial [Lepidochelys olivacea]